MKKIFFIMSVAILMAFLSAPSFVKADSQAVGSALVLFQGNPVVVELYCEQSVTSVYFNATSDLVNQNGKVIRPMPINGSTVWCTYATVLTGYISTLTNDFYWTYQSSTRYIYKDYSDYVDSLPPEFQPAIPSVAEQRWNDFYDWYYDKFGFYPREGSLIDLIRIIAIGDWTDPEAIEITYPTLTPDPPTPTPIPVQTIFVPDGNGNTTIIYQYTDPTTGVITQSPYNPNIDIDVNCDCSGGSSDNTFGTDPTDPTALTSSMLWADGFGVQITDNPLTAANDSQKSLAEAASEYSDSVNVVSNSFNVLPSKWLILVGLLGGILIIAGLIKTFLGG